MKHGSIVMSPEKVILDYYDRSILQMLIDDSRTPISKMSKATKRSKPAVHNRIQQLEKNGIVLDYIAYYDLIRLGYRLYMFLLETDMKHQDKVIESIRIQPFTYAILGLSSPQNLNVWTFSKDEFHIDSIVKEWSKIEGIKNIFKFPVKLMEFRPYKLFNGEKTPSKYYRDAMTIDDIDAKILYSLSFNSRQPITKIAQSLGFTPDTVTYRLKRLMKNRIILSLFTNIAIYRLGYQPYLLMIGLKRKELQQKVFSLIVQDNNSNGQYLLDHDYEIVTMMVVPEISTLKKIIDQIYQIDSEAKIITHLVTGQFYSNALPKGVYEDMLNK